MFYDKTLKLEPPGDNDDDNDDNDHDDEGEDDGGSHPAKFVHIVDSSNFQHQVSSTGHSSKK